MQSCAIDLWQRLFRCSLREKNWSVKLAKNGHENIWSVKVWVHLDNMEPQVILKMDMRSLGDNKPGQKLHCFLNGPFPASFFFIFVFSIQLTLDSKQMFNKFCWWLDSNRGPLALQATALPTEPQPLPFAFLGECFHNENDRCRYYPHVFLKS